MEKDIIKELKGFEMMVEGGKLDGCLVYHESVKSFILSAVSQAKEEGRKQGVEAYKKELKEKIEKDFECNVEKIEWIERVKTAILNLIN
jgi:hypothetical protein